MKIEARVTKWESGKTKGFATITMDDCFVVSGLKIVEGQNGLFVSMPSQKKKEEYKDVCYPITKEFREQITKVVLDKFNDTEDEQDAFPFGD